MSERGAWKLRVGEAVEVFRPDGEPIRFATQKAAEIVGLIVRRQGLVMSRVEIARALWPTKPHEQSLVNLRQALRRLRVAVGSDAPLVIQDNKCWSIPDQWDIEYSHAASEGGPSLEFRSKLDRPQPSAVTGSVDEFRKLLCSSFESNPVLAVELLRANPDFSESLPPLDKLAGLQNVVRRFPKDHPLSSWAQLFYAESVIFSPFHPQALAELDRAAAMGTAQQDVSLVARAEYLRSFEAVVIGRPDVMLDSLKRGTIAANHSKDPHDKMRTKHVRAVSQMHWGSEKRGLAEFDELSEYARHFATDIERAIYESHHALFRATSGDPETAWKALEVARSLTKPGVHLRLDLTLKFVEAEIVRVERTYDKAEKMFDQVLKASTAEKQVGFQIYALESLAAIEVRRGMRTMSDQYLRRADKLRSLEALSLTQWDRSRRRDVVLYAS